MRTYWHRCIRLGRGNFHPRSYPRTQRMPMLERECFHPLQVIYNGELIGKNLLEFIEMIDCSIGASEEVFVCEIQQHEKQILAGRCVVPSFHIELHDPRL